MFLPDVKYIRIPEKNDLPFCMFDTYYHGMTFPLVFFQRNQVDVKFFFQTSQHLRGLVIRSIVDHDNFTSGIEFMTGSYHVFDRGFLVVCTDYDTYFFFHDAVLFKNTECHSPEYGITHRNKLKRFLDALLVDKPHLDK